MQSMIKELTEKVSVAFAACGYDEKLGAVTLSDRQDLCQFQCNGAFAGAKLYRKAPKMIAQEVAAVLEQNPVFAKAETAGAGFINLTVSDDFLAGYVTAAVQEAHFGIEQIGAGQTIVLDYGGPNVAKPLHIGHLRPAIIGEALKRIARSAGYQVVSDVHLGDWGLQMGLVIAEIEERDSNYREKGVIPELTADMLNEIYPFASKKSKEDEIFKARAKEITALLQKGEPKYRDLWRVMIEVSVSDMKRNYARLGVDFDLWNGESDAAPYVDELMGILEQKHLLRESEGALVVDVAEESDKAPVPPMIVQKSDHSSIYATTDLATILQRQRDFSPAKIWYVVDIRQSLHFLQVFRCARMAGLVPESTELAHLPNGTMNGPDGKPFKTRDGGVMKLSDFYDTVLTEARRRIAESEYGSEDEKESTANKIAVAAIKFGDLINHRSKDYIFEMEKFMSSEGKTGAYLLYTIARINSILRKTGENAEPAAVRIYGLYSAEERALALEAAMASHAVLSAVNEKAPNFVCDYAYNLACAFSKFYHNHHIAGETDAQVRASRLGLCVITREILVRCLDMLGIEPVDFM